MSLLGATYKSSLMRGAALGTGTVAVAASLDKRDAIPHGWAVPVAVGLAMGALAGTRLVRANRAIELGAVRAHMEHPLTPGFQPKWTAEELRVIKQSEALTSDGWLARADELSGSGLALMGTGALAGGAGLVWALSPHGAGAGA